MNKFDNKYIIRLATPDDIDSIMQFIDQYWRKGHILARRRDIFEWQYLIDGQVNFMLGIDRESQEIHALFGFIPSSHNPEKRDIWGALWKAREDAIPMLGVELLIRLKDFYPYRQMLQVGINAHTSVPILGLLFQIKTTPMEHFYRLSNNAEYKIAAIKKRPEVMQGYENKTWTCQLKTADEFHDLFSLPEEAVPYKDYWYIKRRYYEHPEWKYLVYGLSDRENGHIHAVLFCRIQECNSSKALRIVDYIGDQKLFAGLNEFFEKWLCSCEYIDMYSHGFDEAAAFDAGMTKLTENDENIIPDYFYPYEACNVDIWVGYNSDLSTAFKGDGDQDRPS